MSYHDPDEALAGCLALIFLLVFYAVIVALPAAVLGLFIYLAATAL